MLRPDLHSGRPDQTQVTDFVCPHCGTLQVATRLSEHLGAAKIGVVRCANCGDVEVLITLYAAHQLGIPASIKRAYPDNDVRTAASFTYAPKEVESAYVDACVLFPIHTGASGAYARRALELILDAAGYEAKSLAASIEAANKESDPDKRLPKRLLHRLDYIKEIGNFALHVRRDDELTIVAIDAQEVTTCLETIEELIQFMFEEPVAEYNRVTALNEKLLSAGKKAIELPVLPTHLEKVKSEPE